MSIKTWWEGFRERLADAGDPHYIADQRATAAADEYARNVRDSGRYDQAPPAQTDDADPTSDYRPFPPSGAGDRPPDGVDTTGHELWWWSPDDVAQDHVEYGPDYPYDDDEDWADDNPDYDPDNFRADGVTPKSDAEIEAETKAEALREQYYDEMTRENTPRQDPETGEYLDDKWVSEGTYSNDLEDALQAHVDAHPELWDHPEWSGWRSDDSVRQGVADRIPELHDKWGINPDDATGPVDYDKARGGLDALRDAGDISSQEHEVLSRQLGNDERQARGGEWTPDDQSVDDDPFADGWDAREDDARGNTLTDPPAETGGNDNPKGGNEDMADDGSDTTNNEFDDIHQWEQTHDAPDDGRPATPVDEADRNTEAAMDQARQSMDESRQAMDSQSGDAEASTDADTGSEAAGHAR